MLMTVNVGFTQYHKHVQPNIIYHIFGDGWKTNHKLMIVDIAYGIGFYGIIAN